jgi:hypothetical protein
MALPPFPKLGLKQSSFEHFIDQCGGRSALINLTTDQVCQRFLKPLTQQKQISYCEHLLSQPQYAGSVGMANVFVSHAWKFCFLDVVDAIMSLKSSRSISDPFIWFDVVSISGIYAFPLANR